MLKKYFFLILCAFWTFAATAQEDDFQLNLDDEEIIGEDEEEVLPDTLVLTEEEKLASMSADERWLYILRKRLNQSLQSHRVTKVTTKKGRGKKAKRVTRTVTRNYRVGVHVYDLTADSVIFSYNARDMYIPASNQKLFVSITALAGIGPDYHFTTNVYLDGEEAVDFVPTYVVKADTLPTGQIVQDTIDVVNEERSYWRGNIYVQGGFDPTLDKAAVDFVAGKVMAMGVDSIDGRVYCYEPQKELTADAAWFWAKHPSKVFASTLYQSLVDNGVTFSQDKAYGTIANPKDFKGIELTSLSTPITDVLQRMMKNSDNYYAESMLLNLCDLFDTGTWSYERCQEEVRKMVRNAGAAPNSYIIADGSGLSHSNKTTAVTVTDILRYAYHNEQVFPALYESLPIAGVDGTIGRRMRNSAAFRNVRAKTGTVSGVSTLSGYVTASNGHKLAFSILVNNVSSSATGHQIQDMLCIDMAK